MHKLLGVTLSIEHIEIDQLYMQHAHFHFFNKKRIKQSVYVFKVTSMLPTDVENQCVRPTLGDNDKILVTVLAILITNIHYLFTYLALGTNIQNMSPTPRLRPHHCHL